MSFRLTRREVLSVSATGLATTGFARASKGKPAAASIPPVEAVITGDEPRVDFEKYRKIVVSPDVNPPEPFHGFGGYCGWPTVCRLQNGDLFMTFSAGYWHASWPTPWDIPAEDKKRFTRGTLEWLADWEAPEGGRMMWVRSRDQGRTWSRPRSFPVVPGAYYVGDVTQLSDGTMFAGVRLKPHWGYFNRMPTTAVEYARIAANRQTKTLILRSDDNGKTWVKPAPGRGFKCDPKSYYPSACVLEDGSIFMVGQREGFKNRFGPHGAEVTSVRFRIRKPEEGEGVELLPIGGRS